MQIKNANLIEQEVSNFWGQFLKKFNNKGPRNVRVKLADDILVYFLEGLLTPVEKNILKSSNGKQIVYEGRRLHLENTKKMRITALEKVIGIKVIEEYVCWDVEKDTAVGVVILEKTTV